MSDSDAFHVGRAPFTTKDADSDYSGLSISDRYLANADLGNSFFNGVNLTNCAFRGVQLNNTEFSEAKVENCLFDEADLSGSDFIDCLFQSVVFAGCSFERGEWREATFRDCQFSNCNFAQTTATLCKFINCSFDAPSLVTAQHRAVYFNVFTHCKFGQVASDPIFVSRNFGVPATNIQMQLVDATAGATIEQMCLLNNLGQFRVADLADVVETICSSLGANVQRRNSTLTFFSKIVRTLTDERRVSATSLIFLEDLITRFASTVVDRDLFMATMVAVVEIRSALFSIVSETPPSNVETEGTVESVTIFFSPTYVRNQVEALRDALAEAAGTTREALDIQNLKSGSTFIEITSTMVVSVGALLISLNFVLRQATVTVRRLVGLKRALDQLNKEDQKKRRKQQLTKQSSNEVRAIFKNGAVAPELIPVRSAVRRSGRTLVEMDEKANVTILAK